MNYPQVVNNLDKLMKYWNLSISELSEKTGLTVSGLKHMMKHGSFKMDSLEKICSAFHIHPVVLFADAIEFSAFAEGDSGEWNIEIRWRINDKSEIGESHKGIPNAKSTTISCVNALWVQLYHETAALSEKIKNLELTIAVDKRMIDTLQKQIEDKSQIIEYARQENLFAYANLIQALLANRTGKDGSMDPEQLTGLTRSRIFDDAFLRKLVDQGLISDADYLYFSQQVKEKK
jgi:DNA-binding Xre family transcriptional regulator